eukprot:gene4352-7188_t
MSVPLRTLEVLLDCDLRRVSFLRNGRECGSVSSLPDAALVPAVDFYCGEFR